ncbi:MAG: hypothetical protein IJ755_03785 [Bacteroidales bacterium]|nr:hypothetical protein [Bacteroidales bacterium]
MLSKSSKIWLIVIEFFILLFVVLAIFMIVEPDEEYGAGIGWVCLIFFGACGIYAPFKFSKEDEASACPRCRKPGALVVTNQQFIRSEPIVKTEDYYQGRKVMPYQVTGHRDHYIETLTCKHCGYSENVRTCYDNWDVNV